MGTEDEESFLGRALARHQIKPVPEEATSPTKSPEQSEPADATAKPGMHKAGRAQPSDEDLTEVIPIRAARPAAALPGEDTQPDIPVVLPAAVPVAAPVVSPAPAPLSSSERALIDEAMKKSGLCWVSSGGGAQPQALWHVWLDGTGYVLTGVGEQPDPGFATPPITVATRSKETMQRLVTFAADVTVVSPDDEDWGEATAALAKSRLNLSDAEHAPDRWRAQSSSQIFRLRPIGPSLLEGPSSYYAGSGRARPRKTPATTAGPPPKVLHQRGGSGRPLS